MSLTCKSPQRLPENNQKTSCSLEFVLLQSNNKLPVRVTESENDSLSTCVSPVIKCGPVIHVPRLFCPVRAGIGYGRPMTLNRMSS